MKDSRADSIDSGDARNLAVLAHADQLYGDRPYVTHLDAVAELVAPYGDHATVIAYLHDVVEDTAVSVETIHDRFGGFVAECVALVTDAPGSNRKERKAGTYARLARVTGPTELALVVKTADRLVNVSSCVEEGRRSLWEMVRREHAAFRTSVHREGLCDPFWQRLQTLLASWPDRP